MILQRTRFSPCGIFGNLLSDDGTWLFCTLEHAYENYDGSYVPKLARGTYTCVRGMHHLENSSSPFETFEVTDTPGHSGILFHVGNTNSDSEGCVLLGEGSSEQSITESSKAFVSFMKALEGQDWFSLTVS